MDKINTNMKFEIIQRIKKINVHTYIFISILLAAILVRCYEITVPFGKMWEIGFQELIAKNHYYYGFTQTHFLSVISIVDGVNIYHLAHPPLLQIIISLSYSLFGVHEWSARIVPIVFSVGSIILLYYITKKLYNVHIALITAFFASFVPMSAYYGRIVNFEAPVLFFVLLVVWGYIQLVETNKKRYFYILLIGVLFGVLTDWPFLIILPILLGIAIITGKKIRATAFLLVMGCVIASGYLILTNSMGGFTFSYFIQKLLHRSDVTSYISNKDFYILISERLLRNFTALLFLLTSVGVIYLIIEKNLKVKLIGKKIDMPTCVSLGLLMFGLLYITVFLQSTFVHEWQMYYLIPGISIFSALGLYAILNFRPKNQVLLRLCTICGGIVLIAFCMLSASSLIVMHGKNFDSYSIGLLINNETKSNDYIDFSSTINPILYYSNRTNVQYIGLPPDIRLIKKYNPKFVGFLSQENVDSSWNRSDFVKTLVDLNYSITIKRPGFQLWSKNISSIFLASKDIHSIDFIDDLTKKPKKGIDSKKFTYTIYQNNSNVSLFEHPICGGMTVVTYELSIPVNASFSFGIEISQQVWSPDKGDGVTFESYINVSGKQSKLFSHYIDPKNNVSDRAPQMFRIPLDNYAGKKVRLSLITSPGPKGDCNYDWAYWINPRIISNS